MKKNLLIPAIALLFTACGGRGTDETASTDPQADSAAIADTTIYGKSVEGFGMSTFAIATEKGDTLYMERGENHLYGNIDNAGDRFAVTCCKIEGTDDLVLLEGINLTNVETITQDFNVLNGRLILEGDTVVIEKLDTDSLVARGTKEHKLAKQK